MSSAPEDLPGTPSASPSSPPSTSSSSSSSSSSRDDDEKRSAPAEPSASGGEDDDDMVAMLEAGMDESDVEDQPAEMLIDHAPPPAETERKPPPAVLTTMPVLTRTKPTPSTTSTDQDEQKQEPTKRRRVLSRLGNASKPDSTAAEPSRKPEAPGSTGCPHPGYFAGMCVACGEPKAKAEAPPGEEQAEETPQESSSLALKYLHPELEVAKHEAERQREKRDETLLSRKKLVLVLDLDHTLLNSIKEKDVKDSLGALQKMANIETEMGEEAKTLFHLPHMGMWTKLRPLVKEFLASAGEIFELYIYTMGNRDYAMQMASVLDPAGVYFRQRIISQNDSTEKHTKSLDIVPVNIHNALILDDTEAVWPQHRGNVVRIERYLYFPGSPKHFGLQSKALMDHDRDEDPKLGALAATLRVLRDVHRLYFEAPDGQRDVRTALRDVKQQVLKDCRLVLSRAFHERHPLAELAAELGAACSQETHEGATHVVAGSRGTDKVKWAKANKVAVVNPHWIEASAHLWVKADEESFPVKDETYVSGVLNQEQEQKNALAAAAGG